MLSRCYSAFTALITPLAQTVLPVEAVPELVVSCYKLRLGDILIKSQMSLRSKPRRVLQCGGPGSEGWALFPALSLAASAGIANTPSRAVHGNNDASRGPDKLVCARVPGTGPSTCPCPPVVLPSLLRFQTKAEAEVSFTHLGKSW